MNTENSRLVDSVEKLEKVIASVKAAQKKFATYTQEQVDKIFLAASIAANQQRLPLAEMAVEETGMGVVEDKVIKNHYASEYIYNAYRNTKTCGVIEEDKAFGIMKIAEPIGVIGAVIPTTNPTSQMLLHTRPDLTVQAIADMLSFDEQATFSRYFRRETGISPSEFRKRK